MADSAANEHDELTIGDPVDAEIKKSTVSIENETDIPSTSKEPHVTTPLSNSRTSVREQEGKDAAAVSNSRVSLQDQGELIAGSSRQSLREAENIRQEEQDRLNAMMMEGDSDIEKEDWFDAPTENEDLDRFLSELHDPEQIPIPENRDVHDTYEPKISSLRTEMETTAVPLYLDEFEDTVKDDVVLLAPVSIGDIQQEELRLREEHVAYNKYLAEQQQLKKKEIAEREETAKERLIAELRRRKLEITRREELLAKQEKLYQERLQNAFRKSESQLKQALDERKGEVDSFYGDLTFADDHYGGSKGRRWRVEWSKTPQPIQVKLKSVRGLRDKIPAGRYVMMVSLYDRLGGHVRRWSRLTGQQWGGSTLPIFHDGRYSSAQIPLEQSVFTVVPSKDEVRPGMVLIFELFLLRGAITPTDRVVAWACFPICDGQFEIIQGHYKAPMLRGHMDTRIDKHGMIEELVATDLDHWLANVYFQIIRLPRYLSGQKEYEVELQFSSGLLSYPDRILDAEEAVDGEDTPERSDDVSTSGIESIQSGSNMSLNLISGKESSLSSSSTAKFDKELEMKRRPSSGIRYRGSTARSAKRKLEKKIDGIYSSSSEEDSDYESRATSDDKGQFMSVKNQSGMYYKVHFENPVEDYNKKRTATLIPHTAVLNAKRPKPKLTHLEELERHSYAVQPPFSTKGRLKRTGHERADYVRRMFLAEMGFAQWRTREFWTTMLLLALLWFVRLYVHYCGQWLFLQAISIPVNSFVFFPYTVDLNYQSDLLKTGEIIGIVVLGPLANIIVLLLFVLVSWLSQATMGTFPLLFSKFIMAYALWTTVDPIAILIVDSALGRYQFSASQPIGDAYKLYWHFLRIQGSGVIGVPLTVYLYVLLMFTSIVVLYLYFLKLHNNGRMLDIFHRLHGEEGIFFVPFDLEVSIQELGYIVKKAEQWRGADGERRKVTVYDYIWGEETEVGENETSVRKEITTHVSIHTLHLDGLRELYRHFLRLPSGAIVEILGELGSAKLMPDVKTALLKRATSVENFFSEHGSMSRLPPSTAGTVSMQDLRNHRVENKTMLGIPSQVYGKSDENLDRPPTSDTLKTRKTIVNHDSVSSGDGQEFSQQPATLQIPIIGSSEL
ncbi:uncharacterized protein LOC144421905 [Styela clava]